MARKRTLKIDGIEVEIPRGIEIVQGRIRMNFQYLGQTRYEPYGSTLSRKAIKDAGIMRASIVQEIQQGRFDYQSRFPNSKRALELKGLSQYSPRTTVGQMLEEEHTIIKGRKSPSTQRNSISLIARISTYFGKNTHVREITAEWCEKFKSDLRSKFSAKTVNNNLVPLRAILKRAYQRGILRDRVHDRFSNIPADETRPQNEVQPFDLEDLRKLETAWPERAQDRDMFLFNAWTGLSVSELMALAWEDVDRTGDVWKLHIQRAKVHGIWKVPKEAVRNRNIEINSRAKEYLSRQLAYVAVQPLLEVGVLQRDNQTTINEEIHPVFLNSNTNESWTYVALERMFKTLCKKAGVPERPPNQLRHTFASRMLTAGVPIPVLVHLMGHSNEIMLRRHYARWIESDTKGKIARAMDEAIEKLET